MSSPHIVTVIMLNTLLMCFAAFPVATVSYIINNKAPYLWLHARVHTSLIYASQGSLDLVNSCVLLMFGLLALLQTFLYCNFGHQIREKASFIAI